LSEENERLPETITFLKGLSIGELLHGVPSCFEVRQAAHGTFEKFGGFIG
jgi:hypothetical protein